MLCCSSLRCTLRSINIQNDGASANSGYLYSDDFLVACIAATQLCKLVTKKGMVMTKQETREDVLRFATDRENREDSSFASAAHLQP